MATRAKDTNPGIAKEKRKILSSPSFSRPTNTTRKSVNTTTTTTIAPNYIKPVSTKASSSTLPKPDLDRRRSFGSKPLSQPKKPAPAAISDKSPTITGPVVRPKPRTERSRSSSSLKAPASALPRSKVDTTAKKPVPVKSSRPATRPATTAVYKKKQPQSNAVAKTLKSTISSAKRDLPKKSDSIDEIDAKKSDHEVETDSCQDIQDRESICSSVVDAINENDNTEMSLDMIHDDQLEQLEQINEDAYLLSEASTVVSEIEQSEAELENKVNEVTEKLQLDNTKIEQSEAELENRASEVNEKLQQDNTNNDESKSDADNANDANSNKDVVESEEEKVTCNETSEKNYVAAAEEEEKPVDDKNEKLADKEKEVEQVIGGDEQVKSENDGTEKKINNNTEGGSKNNEKLADKEKEVENVSGGVEQVKSENDDTKKKINNNSAGWSNKKETSAASNDVIEEAASKLRVKRKNKVLALVGAFETVMSSKD